jgi:hypothetical protein
MLTLGRADARHAATALTVLIWAPIACVAIAVQGPTALSALVVLNLVVLAVLLAVWAWSAQRAAPRIDVFSPLTIFVVSWVVMFVIRPIGMAAAGDMTLRGIFDVSQGVPLALLLAAVGAVAFAAGYGMAASRAGADHVRDRTRSWQIRPGAMHTVAILCIVFAALGGILSSAGIDSAYVAYLPLLAVPGSLLMLAVERARWGPGALVAVGGLILPLLPALAVGQRSTVLFVGGSLAVLLYLRRRSRPRVAMLAIGTLSFLLLIVNGLEVLRAPVQAGQTFDPTVVAADDLTPDAAVRRFVTGGSTEMLPALALQIQTEGTVWSISPGYLVASAVAHWVPGSLWSDKPVSSAELLYSRYFPEWYFYSKANSQFSILGDFYFDLGAMGVVLGMFLLGAGSRLMAGLLVGASTSHAAQLFYAPFVPLFVVLLRGDIPLSLGLALYIYGPLMVAAALGGLGRRPQPASTRFPRRPLYAGPTS